MPNLPHPRFLMFLLVLVLASTGLATHFPVERALVLGFDTGALVFICSCLPLWRETEVAVNRSRAERDDGGRAFLLLVAVATLVAVLAALVRIVQRSATQAPSDIVAVVGTLALAWVFVNTVYAFHYAHLYYDQTDGGDVRGLGFPGPVAPVFSDFCYFSFTIGMTCQTSDVAVETPGLRRAVTVHGFLSYVFNLGVLAMVINVLVGVL